MKQLINKIKELGWQVQKDGDYYELGKFSPAGHDFWISVECNGDAGNFINELYEVYENFDVSYETYLWLDDEGHGRKGAPWDMRDLYNDMEASEKNIYKLHSELERFYQAEWVKEETEEEI